MVTFSEKPRRNMVFIAEDDPDDQLIIQKANSIAQNPCRFTFFNDGQQLIDYLHDLLLRSSKDTAHFPSLIILDLNMPRKNGFEVLEHLQNDERLHNIPVVVLTSSHDLQDKERSYERGARDFLSKPFGLKEYAAMISTWERNFSLSM